jgi:hypothetical protein
MEQPASLLNRPQERVHERNECRRVEQSNNQTNAISDKIAHN